LKSAGKTSPRDLQVGTDAAVSVHTAAHGAPSRTSCTTRRRGQQAQHPGSLLGEHEAEGRAGGLVQGWV